MLTTYPLLQTPDTAGTPVVRSLPAALPHPSAPDAWRYPTEPRSKKLLAAAMVISVGVHAAILLGFNRHQQAVRRPVEDTTITVTFVLPPMPELAEPEVGESSRDSTIAHFENFVAPRLMDLPSIVSATDFVQPLDVSTLVGTPDLGLMTIPVLPEGVGEGKIAEKIGQIFNIADLDRAPEVIYQPAFVYPPNLKQAGIQGSLTMQFVVDENGIVHDPVVVDSSHMDFEKPVLTGLLRWKFKPGFKDGRKVSTRMRIPIVFRLAD